MKYTYETSGTCSSEINFEIDSENKVRNLSFKDGCNGNLQGIAKLVEGMSAGDVIEKCGGIKCGHAKTSCPDQLAKAIEKASIK